MAIFFSDVAEQMAGAQVKTVDTFLKMVYKQFPDV